MAIITGLMMAFNHFKATHARVPRRLVEVVMVVPGEKVPDLDTMFMNASFSTPSERRHVLEELLDIATPQSLEAGFVRVLARSSSSRTMLDRARRRFRNQMKRAQLGEYGDVDLSVARAADPPSEAALLGLIITRPRDSGKPITGSTWDARNFLWRLRLGVSEGPLAMYLYYAPDPGTTLAEPEAERMLERLKDT
ncbi:MAG: hypothetical protein PVF40_12255, partial [Ectothiorhodospiraceae bacterium]|jgi:hypothetical protein